MKEAFEAITPQTKVNVKYSGNLTKQQSYAHGAQDINLVYEVYVNAFKTKPSSGYKARHKRLLNYYDFRCQQLMVSEEG